MSGFYEVTLRNCSTGQHLLIAATVAMEFMQNVSEDNPEKVCYEKDSFEFMVRYKEGSVIVTKL